MKGLKVYVCNKRVSVRTGFTLIYFIVYSVPRSNTLFSVASVPDHLLYCWFCPQIIYFTVDSVPRSFTLLLILSPDHLLYYWFCPQIIYLTVDSVPRSFTLLLMLSPDHIVWFCLKWTYNRPNNNTSLFRTVPVISVPKEVSLYLLHF